MRFGESVFRVSDLSWRGYWIGFAVALFFLLWVDLATTIVAASVHGLHAEANPIMRWLLAQGLLVTVTVHLLVLALVSLAFAGVMRVGRSLDGSTSRQYRIGCLVWLGTLIFLGLLVSVNNTAVTLIGLLG